MLWSCCASVTILPPLLHPGQVGGPERGGRWVPALRLCNCAGTRAPGRCGSEPQAGIRSLCGNSLCHCGWPEHWGRASACMQPVSLVQRATRRSPISVTGDTTRSTALDQVSTLQTSSTVGICHSWSAVPRNGHGQCGQMGLAGFQADVTQGHRQRPRWPACLRLQRGVPSPQDCRLLPACSLPHVFPWQHERAFSLCCQV